MTETPWHLVGDIGGSNARFGIAFANSDDCRHVATYEVSAYPHFYDVIERLLDDIALLNITAGGPIKICLAVAAIPSGERVCFTNSTWQFEVAAVKRMMNAEEVLIINDFAAVARALPCLAPGDLVQIGSGKAAPNAPMLAIGPGTGLGVAALVGPHKPNAHVVWGEGGHVDFAAVTEDETITLRWLRRHHDRVSLERVCCGDGILSIYRALGEHHGLPVVLDHPAAIGDAARRGEHLPRLTMTTFFGILGGAAGNFALTFGATGGVYIAGGIAPRYLDMIEESPFRERFLAKGRFAQYLSTVPTYIVTHKELGLLGASLFIHHS